MSTRAVIFDFNGTLSDDEPLLRRWSDDVRLELPDGAGGSAWTNPHWP